MSKEGVHNLTSKADWEQVLETKDTLLVLDCFATWCGPCKMIAPQVVKYAMPSPVSPIHISDRIRLSDTYPQARFLKIDVDEVPDVAQELGIRAMPTFLLFANKEKVGEVVGANLKALEAAIKSGLEKTSA
ncbi:thioredoxin trx1 [Didymosphaeria variabile]|uniref:Thioredoxin n=1 Tax=Didymosphaeria variabile TaxID=1932322 RepID=A0A9W8XJQ6_9PLEO|nr:thioredoxin trx1 [Didymosphaeria variabile]KAJ4351486.1 thioredoxin trx1 [Didymosphaeria variabile]